MLVLVIVIALVLLGLCAVIAAAETAVVLLPPGRVHRLVEAERPGATALDALADVRHRLRAVSMLTAGVAFAAGAAAGARVATDLAGDVLTADLAASYESPVMAVGAFLAVLMVHSFGQALPRTLAVSNPERIGLDTARFALTYMRAVYPLARVLGGPWKWAVSIASGERPISPWAVTPEWRGGEQDDEAEREEAEEALLEAVSDFAEKVAREVMVPRTDMKALPDTASVADAIALIGVTGYSRLPVYHETVDDVRGVLYAKDLLGAVGNGGGGATVLSLCRQPYFVPETKPVEELLVEMRERTHIAIVADEYGGTSGLVTLEDLLEEIVGDISDEYDREEPLLTDHGDGRFSVDARLPVDDLNERFGTDIETEVDSIGGLFTEVLGRIPSQGEAVEIEGLRLTVTDLEGTRIRKLCVEPAAPADEGGDHA